MADTDTNPNLDPVGERRKILKFTRDEVGVQALTYICFCYKKYLPANLKEEIDKDPNPHRHTLQIIEELEKKCIFDVQTPNDTIEKLRELIHNKSVNDNSQQGVQETCLENNSIQNIQGPLVIIGQVVVAVLVAAWLSYMQKTPAFVGQQLQIQKPRQMFEGGIVGNILEDYRLHVKETSNDLPLIHVLTGMAGVGKTENALQYMSKYCDVQYQRKCFWLRGSTDRIEFSVRQMCSSINEKCEQSASIDIILDLIFQWLTDQSALVILDDVASPYVLEMYFPSSFPPGTHVIVTSRYTTHQWNERLTGVVKYIPIPLLDQNQSMLNIARRNAAEKPEQIWKRIKSLGDKEVSCFEELVDKLGGLPLALVQARGKIWASHPLQFCHYLKGFQQSLDNLLPKTFAEEEALTQFLISMGMPTVYTTRILEVVDTLSDIKHLNLSVLQSEPILMSSGEARMFKQTTTTKVGAMLNNTETFRSLQATLGLNIQTINKSVDKSSRHAVQLLQILSVLQPYVHEYFLVRGAKYVNSTTMRDYLVGESFYVSSNIVEKFRAMYTSLGRYSLVNSSCEKAKCSKLDRIINTHPLVQKFVARLVKKDPGRLLFVFNSIVKSMIYQFPTESDLLQCRTHSCSDHPEYVINEEIIGHLQSLHQNINVTEIIPNASYGLVDPFPLIVPVAIYLQRQGNAQNGIAIVQFLLDFVESYYQDSFENISKIGRAHRLLGKLYYDSVPFGDNDTDKIRKSLNKAEAQIEIAIKYLNVCCDQNPLELGLGYQDLARVFQGYMFLLIESGDFEMDVNLVNRTNATLLKALEYKDKAFRTEEPESESKMLWKYYQYAIAWSNIGRFYQDLGDYPKAEDALIKSIQIKLQTNRTGENHWVEFGLALYLDKAEEYLLQALQYKKTHIPVSHSSYALTLYYLARMLKGLPGREYEFEMYIRELTDCKAEHFLERLNHNYLDLRQAYPPDAVIWI